MIKTNSKAKAICGDGYICKRKLINKIRTANTGRKILRIAFFSDWLLVIECGEVVKKIKIEKNYDAERLIKEALT